jgi:phage antirepressor YoqD-like protein
MENMNIQVLEANNVLTMSSLEIAELTGKRHDNVMSDIEKMLKDLEIHAPDFSGTYKTARGNEYKCYKLPKRETLILVSGYNVTVRARIIDRWQELEQKESAQFKMPKTLSEALLLAGQQAALAEERQRLLEQQKPKVEFAETVERSDGTLSIGEFAKLLPKEWKIGRNKLFKWLRDNKYLMKDNVPYQRYVNEGLFEVIETVNEYDSQDYINLLTLITGKGQLYVTGKLKETLGLV